MTTPTGTSYGVGRWDGAQWHTQMVDEETATPYATSIRLDATEAHDPSDDTPVGFGRRSGAMSS